MLYTQSYFTNSIYTYGDHFIKISHLFGELLKILAILDILAYNCNKKISNIS